MGFNPFVTAGEKCPASGTLFLIHVFQSMFSCQNEMKRMDFIWNNVLCARLCWFIWYIPKALIRFGSKVMPKKLMTVGPKPWPLLCAAPISLTLFSTYLAFLVPFFKFIISPRPRANFLIWKRDKRGNSSYFHWCYGGDLRQCVVRSNNSVLWEKKVSRQRDTFSRTERVNALNSKLHMTLTNKKAFHLLTSNKYSHFKSDKFHWHLSPIFPR